jgi:nucleoside-diphosphate-sugar epimerase
MGRLLVARLLARGDRITLFNRGETPDPFGGHVERLRGDREKGDLARLTLGRAFDAAVDFTAYRAADLPLHLDVGHYVFISSGQVYLVLERAPAVAREEDYDGAVMARPTSSERDGTQWDYGAGKRACEDVLTSNPSFPATRLRIPMVNGPRDPDRRIEHYVHALLRGEPLRVHDPERRVRHVDAMEVARTIELLLDKPASIGQAFNQAHDEIVTLRELLELIMREVSIRAPIEVGDSPLSVKWMSFIDPSRIRAFGIDHAPLERTLPRAVGYVMGELGQWSAAIR